MTLPFLKWRGHVVQGSGATGSAVELWALLLDGCSRVGMLLSIPVLQPRLWCGYAMHTWQCIGAVQWTRAKSLAKVYECEGELHPGATISISSGSVSDYK